MIKETIKIWNNNFNKGVSPFQMCLIVSMLIGLVVGSQITIFVSMFSCLFGYLEPTNSRYSFHKENEK